METKKNYLKGVFFINFDIVVELRLKMKQNENILKRCN